MVFGTPYLQNEFGDPRIFYVFNLILSFSTGSQSFKKICAWEVFGRERHRKYGNKRCFKERKDDIVASRKKSMILTRSTNNKECGIEENTL